jgi:hypothetical protein
MAKVKYHEVPITVSRQGSPCIWERGGLGKKNWTFTILVAGKNYERLNAIATLKEENGRHALIPIAIGCYTFEYQRNKDTEDSITIWRIVSIDKIERRISLEFINSRYKGTWVTPLSEYPMKVEEIVSLLEKKSNSADCTTPVYAGLKFIDPLMKKRNENIKSGSPGRTSTS